MESKKIAKEKKGQSHFDNIKNNYFLIQLFSYLQKNISLCIIKYNKNIQKRLNLSINDYKKYTEELSPIEIEITPIKDYYDKFINTQEE